MNQEVKDILNNLKKPCHKISYKQHYAYWEETDPEIFKTSCFIDDEAWIRDEEGREFVFQIINHKGLFLPNEITKLQLYYHLQDSSMNLVITDDEEEYIEPEKFNNTNGVMFLTPSYNLPDWKTLEDLHIDEFNGISSIIEKENPKLKKYDFYEKYDEYVEKILGHENHYSFVGGNLNQAYHLTETPSEKFKFIMQIETECNGGDTIYIFQNNEDRTQYLIETAQ